jgi:hypothetical protein
MTHTELYQELCRLERQPMAAVARYAFTIVAAWERYKTECLERGEVQEWPDMVTALTRFAERKKFLTPPLECETLPV